MGSRLRSHLRHNLVAYVALFFALGGTSASAANTVFSSDIVDGEVKNPDIARTRSAPGSWPTATSARPTCSTTT